MHMTRIIVFLLLFVCIAQNGTAQKSLVSFIEEIEPVSSKEFFYKNEWIDTIKMKSNSGQYLNDIANALKNTGLEFYIHQDQYVFIYPNKLEFERLKESNNSSIKAKDAYQYIRIGDPDLSVSEKKYLLTGVVTDEKNDPILGATILVKSINEGAVTDSNGRYSLELYPDNYEIEFNYLGLEPETKYVTFYSAGQVDQTLYQGTFLLEEVVIEGLSSEAQLNESVIGKTKIKMATLESMPAFLGEVDVLKSATMLPGVNVSGESSSYLNIRGGRNDQTLVLMNNAPVFTPGHLLGFFSVFNGDFVSDLSLYKGNIPSKYGTRASSVMDVRLGQWANKKVNFYGGIGIVNTNLGLKAKFLDDKLDIHIGGRASYSDWLFDLAQSEDIEKSSARFRDENLIARYIPDQSNTFHLSLYNSFDYFKYSDQVIFEWKANNGSIEWDHLFGNGWVTSSQVIFSDLDNSSEGLEINDGYLLNNGISMIGFQQELSLDAGTGELDAGVEFNSYKINPGDITPLGNISRIEAQTLEEEHANSIGLYVDYEIKLFDKLTINPGLRYSIFQNIGAREVNVYQENSPLTEENVLSSKFYGDGDVISTYNRFEPRIGMNWSWGNQSIKAGFTRTNQFLHLVANTALINPVSVWKASDQFIQPTLIDQYSLGYQINLNSSILMSIEGYHKIMQNLVDYKDGAELVLNGNLEQSIVGGDGTSYGLEFLLSKTKGIFKGWASYTYSRAFIKTTGNFPSEEINGGKRYAYYSDRPHNIQMNADWKMTKKWSLSANYVFSSGAPTSAPTNVIQINGINVPYFPERNAVRLPDYHRLDIAISFKSRIRKTKKNNDRWVLSFYNVYGRRNASTVFFARRDGLPSQPYKLVSIGNVVPTFTYKFEI